MKRTITTILTAILLLALLAACGTGTNDGATGNPPSASPAASAAATAAATDTAAPDEAEKPRELTIAANRFAQHVDWDQMYIWQKFEEDTGIKVTWDYIQGSAIAEQRNLRVSTGNLPDAFYGGRWTAQELAQYASEGIFVPIDEYLPTYAPNTYKFYNDNPDILQSMKLHDGKIYGWPIVYVDKIAGTSISLREEWMTELGLDLPKTPNDLLEVMKAMKAADPSRLIYSSYNNNTAYSGLVNTLMGSWGLGNRGAGINSYFDANPDDPTKLRFYATDERFKELLTLLHEMYAAGCIDPDTLVQDEVAWGAKAAQKDPATVGVVTTSVLFAYNAQNDYVGTGVLTGPYGDNLWSSVRQKVARNANFIITSACENIPIAVEFADYWMTEEHSVLFFDGEEGNHWNWDENRERRIPAEWLTNDPQGRSLDQMRSTWTSQPGGSYFGIILPSPVNPDDKEQVAAQLVKPYLPEIAWPVFNLTTEELSVTSAQGVDIRTHYEESVTAFVNGTRDLNTDWDAYVKTFSDMGLDRLTQVYQDAYDRYLAGGGQAS